MSLEERVKMMSIFLFVVSVMLFVVSILLIQCSLDSASTSSIHPWGEETMHDYIFKENQ